MQVVVKAQIARPPRRLDGLAPEFRDGRALHVDRLALRGAVIAEAVPNFRSFGVA